MALLAAVGLHAALAAALLVLPTRQPLPTPAEPDAMVLTLADAGDVAEVPLPATLEEPPEPPAPPQVDAPPETVAVAEPPPDPPSPVPAPPPLPRVVEQPLPPPPPPQPPAAARPQIAVAPAPPAIGRTTVEAPVAAPAGPSLGARLIDNACPNREIAYPAAAESLGIGGVVRLRLRISDDGRVVEAAIAESSGFAVLDEAARGGVRACRFLPALRDGRPVWSTAAMPVTFQNPGGGRR